jgi:hypothetical protein
VNAVIELVNRRAALRLCRAIDAGRAAHPVLVRAGFGGSLRCVTAYTVADGIGQGVPRWSRSSGVVPPVDRVVRPPTFRGWETVR